MDTMTIAQILRGTEPRINPATGRIAIQAVGYMQIIPLVSDLVDLRFSPPDKAEISTTNYGTMIVKNLGTNEETETMIMPMGAGYITKQNAQDHATPSAKIISPKAGVTIDTAACIQESQGGYIRGDVHNYTIIPWALKETALASKDEKSYTKLWPAIKDFNSSLGITGGSHLEYFMENFNDQLDKFIAQFEIVPKQVGAIILVNGEVVGIERTPNYEYWYSIWTPLIRECYGSLVLQFAKSFGDVSELPKSQVPLTSKIDSLDQLRLSLEKAQGEEETKAKNLIRDFISDPFDLSADEQVQGVSVETATNKQFVGQIIRDDEKVIYASLVTARKWVKNRPWYEAKEFKV